MTTWEKMAATALAMLYTLGVSKEIHDNHVIEREPPGVAKAAKRCPEVTRLEQWRWKDGPVNVNLGIEAS